MFKFFQKPPKTDAEKKLEEISKLLFPEPEEAESPDGDKFLVDYSVDMNLDAALVDLEEGHNDEVCRKTIKKVANRLYEVRQLLNAHYIDGKKFNYVVVDDVRAMDD